MGLKKYMVKKYLLLGDEVLYKKKNNFNSDIFDLFENYLYSNNYITCRYENLEAYDIVYLIQKKMLNIDNNIRIVIITNDGDYLQMYRENVKIYNMQFKDLSLKINYHIFVIFYKLLNHYNIDTYNK